VGRGDAVDEEWEQLSQRRQRCWEEEEDKDEDDEEEVEDCGICVLL
jgi:hypothetical protein